MADISKCLGEWQSMHGEGLIMQRCPIRDKCYRFNAPRGIKQSMIIPCYSNKTGKCEYLIER